MPDRQAVRGRIENENAAPEPDRENGGEREEAHPAFLLHHPHDEKDEEGRRIEHAFGRADRNLLREDDGRDGSAEPRAASCKVKPPAGSQKRRPGSDHPERAENRDAQILRRHELKKIMRRADAADQSRFTGAEEGREQNKKARAHGGSGKSCRRWRKAILSIENAN